MGTVEINKVVEEIHSKFCTADVRVIEEAKNLSSKRKKLFEQKERNDKLGDLGFTYFKGKDFNPESRLEKARKEVEAINHYKLRYPHLKFITRDEINRICSEYGLVFGTADQYTGDIPVSNQKDILKFKMNDEDVKVNSWYLKIPLQYDTEQYETEELTKEKLREIITKYVERYFRVEELRDGDMYNFYNSDMMHLIIYNGEQKALDVYMGSARRKNIDVEAYVEAAYKNISKKQQFNIVAPQEDMLTKNQEEQVFFYPDPVVLQKVNSINSIELYAIVTAWGPEANDPAIYNELMN